MNSLAFNTLIHKLLYPQAELPVACWSTVGPADTSTEWRPLRSPWFRFSCMD